MKPKDNKTKEKTILEITEGLSKMFEEYAALEYEQGSYFTADVWKKAAEMAKSYPGSWDNNLKIPDWKGPVKGYKEMSEKPDHFGCIPIDVSDL